MSKLVYVWAILVSCSSCSGLISPPISRGQSPIGSNKYADYRAFRATDVNEWSQIAKESCTFPNPLSFNPTQFDFKNNDLIYIESSLPGRSPSEINAIETENSITVSFRIVTGKDAFEGGIASCSYYIASIKKSPKELKFLALL